MIELQHLTKDFGPIKAVDKLDLTVPRSTTVGFLGPNGAGKTTTIKILTNLISATSGKAMLNGVNVIEHPKTALSHVGAVVETPEFYPYLTPNETLAYIGSVRGMSHSDIVKRSNEVLQQVKLDPWRTTRVGKFSKGMKQRLAIAQALLHEPDILILDEPTSGLDPRGMVEVREIIRELKKQKYTIFMSSHLLGEVQEICDRAALIDHGKLLVYDSIENLKGLTKIDKIEVMTASDTPDSMLDRIRSLARVKGVDRVNGRTLVVTYEGSPEERADLLISIQSAGARVTGFSPVGIPLEMMYMDLVKESR
jgi:ABC-2 type transport system ATP-binding protein